MVSRIVGTKTTRIISVITQKNEEANPGIDFVTIKMCTKVKIVVTEKDNFLQC